MTISKLRSEWAYVSGRVAALASRPLMLLAINHLGGNELASTVAVVFLVAMLAMAVSAFDTHRHFYQSFFGHRPVRGVRDRYRSYCAATALQIAMVIPLLIGFITYRFNDTLLALLVAGYFASERLADESQRFLIFGRRRQEWGWRIMGKAVIQLFGVTASVALVDSYAAHLSVVCLLVGNLVAYGSKVFKRHLPASLKDWGKAFQTCLQQRLFWLLSMITTAILYLDRVVVMSFQQSDMAAYTILVSSMAIIQNAVDYFFVSIRRRDILQGQLSLRGVFLNRGFCLTLGISALAGCAVSWGMLRLYHGLEIKHIGLIPISLVSQIALAITMVMREIIYWNHSISSLTILEGGFIVSAFVGFYLIHLGGFGYEAALGVTSLLLTFRVFLMAWGISRFKNK